MKRLGQKLNELKHNAPLFPSDLTDLPLITIKGNEQFNIENVYTLLFYSTNKIGISTENKTIEITGEDMKLKSMMKEELMIEGKLHEIRFL